MFGIQQELEERNRAPIFPPHACDPARSGVDFGKHSPLYNFPGTQVEEEDTEVVGGGGTSFKPPGRRKKEH